MSSRSQGETPSCFAVVAERRLSVEREYVFRTCEAGVPRYSRVGPREQLSMGGIHWLGSSIFRTPRRLAVVQGKRRSVRSIRMRICCHEREPRRPPIATARRLSVGRFDNRCSCRIRAASLSPVGQSARLSMGCHGTLTSGSRRASGDPAVVVRLFAGRQNLRRSRL